MADLSITAANVLAGAGAQKQSGSALEAVTAGKGAYYDPATKKFGLWDSNSATAAVRKMAGIFLNGAGASQPVVVQTGGKINLGATLVAGEVYFQSETPGGIQPYADLVTGEYVGIVGVAVSTSELELHIKSFAIARG
jgi:hypothetical protein